MKIADVDIEKVSPMMRQYMEIKKNNPDIIIMFRLGDFYEMFFEDAINVSHEVIEKGYNYVDWSIDSGDSKSRSASSYEIYKNVINSLSVNRVNIVLMHDIKKQNIESTELIIKYALANGWTCLPISENTPLVKARVNN